MLIKLSNEVKKAIEILEANNYKVYIVGGAIRDHFLSLPVNDIDLVTNASLLEIEVLFSNYKVIKFKKGHTYAVVIEGKLIEISTIVGENIIEDLKNRDFTINAIAYNELEGLIDPFNGINDINNKILKAPNNPIGMIRSDPLRILRAIRFKVILGFDIECTLKKEMIENAYLLNKIPKHRYIKELDYILLSDNPSNYIREYKEIFFEIFKPLKDTYDFNQHSKWHHLDVFEHTMVVLDSTKRNITLRLAALLHDIMKPRCFTIDENKEGHFYNHCNLSSEYAKEILSDIGYSSNMVDDVFNLIYYHDRGLSNNNKALLKLLNAMGDKNIDLYFDLRRSDVLGQHPKLLYRINEINEIEDSVNRLILNKAPYKLSNLKIDGNHLFELGFKDNEIGNTLSHILKKVMSGGIPNEKSILIKYADSIKNRNY